MCRCLSLYLGKRLVGDNGFSKIYWLMMQQHPFTLSQDHDRNSSVVPVTVDQRLAVHLTDSSQNAARFYRMPPVSGLSATNVASLATSNLSFFLLR